MVPREGWGGPSLLCWEEVTGFSAFVGLNRTLGTLPQKGIVPCYHDTRKVAYALPHGLHLPLVAPPSSLKGGQVSPKALSLTSQVEPAVTSISSAFGSAFVMFPSVHGNWTHTINLFLILWATSWQYDSCLLWPWLDVKERLKCKWFHPPFPDSWTTFFLLPYQGTCRF